MADEYEGWDKDNKPWDPTKPFHRIKSTSYNESLDPVSGDGYARGCHHTSDGPDDSIYGLIIRDLVRTIPGWMPVQPEDKEQELEGVLERCFQTWTDVPLYQWHRYYDWNFHIIPAKGYRYVMGLGNQHGAEPNKPDRLMTPKSMECEWDCGAFGPRPGIMFNNDQWIWPMMGQYCWTAGRWIYDCGHANEHGLMRSEIHPVKAMATAQWEAVKFPENGNLYVPGIRFMFFASKLGGYKEFPPINNCNYDFILDLPENQGTASPWLLGHTPDFPMNTGVLRTPHLLHRPQFLKSGDGVSDSVEPIWEPIPSTVPSQLPRQIKLTIPLQQLSNNTTYYGVIMNFGWFDPDQSQARKVKRCKIFFDHFHKENVNHDIGAEEWMLKFGVNGRWYTRTFNDVHNDRDYPLKVDVPEFYLADTDAIRIASHGAELDQMDEVFDREIPRRTLRLYGADVKWDEDVVAGTADPTTNAANRRRLWDMVYEIAGMLPGGDPFLNWLGIEDGRANNPLGIIDPEGERADNPLKVDTLNLDKSPASQVAFYAQEMGETAELIERRTRKDYILHYEVTVKPQVV
jgi:hypothetical protein